MSAYGLYVRWTADTQREGRVFPPLDPAHPLADVYCPACGELLGNGEPVLLLALGPGKDEEAREKHAAGRWYTAAALPIHQACLGGDDA